VDPRGLSETLDDPGFSLSRAASRRTVFVQPFAWSRDGLGVPESQNFRSPPLGALRGVHVQREPRQLRERRRAGSWFKPYLSG